MKVSKKWLQKFFEQELPSTEVLADTIMFHAFEVEGIEQVKEDEVLDLKVLQRGHDCLSHRGVAKELAALLKVPLAHDPFVNKSDISKKTDAVIVKIDTPLCKRYIAGYVKGVKVGPSPQWLRERLEAIGQRSINNVVDATNFVMFNTGQPLHAFDAGKLVQKEGTYSIEVRAAQGGEKIVALDNKEYALTSSMLVIADKHKGDAVGIAGVKGGTPAAITESTTDIIIESANFDSVSVRKTAQALKLRTDASVRFEQGTSPELAARGMEGMLEFIQHQIGGEIVGFVDIYPAPQKPVSVSVTTQKVNQVLGITLTGADIADVFQRLQFPYKEENEVFTVMVPFERLDITIAEDLVEEVGRIVGYDKIPALPMPPTKIAPEINKNFYWSEIIREKLVSKGFSEVLTNVFSEKGERIVLNKVDGERPYLRTNLSDGLKTVLEKNIRNKEILNLQQVKIFEIGSVWRQGKEFLAVGLAVELMKKMPDATTCLTELAKSLGLVLKIPTAMAPAIDIPIDDLVSKAEISNTYPDFLPSTTVKYKTFSKYPYIVRDISMWTPAGTDADEVLEAIKKEAGELCVKCSLFDTFEKEGKKSLAFRLIFQSLERTLIEDEVNKTMAQLSAFLVDKGFEIR